MLFRNQGRHPLRGAAPLLLALPVIFAGCGEDGLVNSSKEALESTMASSADHAAYGVALVVSNPSPYAEEIVNQMIGSENFKSSREAIKAIVNDPPASSEVALRSVYETKRGLLKLDAAIALARLGDEAALAWVKEQCLDETGQSLTLAAVRLLAEKGEAEALTPFLRSRMGNDEPSLRNEAYVMLGAIKQDWATDLLVEGLGNEFGPERETAIQALGQTGNPKVAPSVEKFVNTQGLVFVSLESLGRLDNADSIAVLEGQLDHKNELVRVFAAASIWRLGEKEKALAVLEPLATSDDPAMRLAVAQQIQGIKDDQAKQMLTTMASDEDGSIRLEAIRSLSSFEDPSLAPLFVTAIADKSYLVGTSALDALARVGSAEALEAIEPMLENRNPYVVMSAANAVLAIKERQPA